MGLNIRALDKHTDPLRFCFRRAVMLFNAQSVVTVIVMGFMSGD